MATRETVIGIDLGTTHSVVATVADGQPTVIRSRSGHLLTPSVVAITQAGKRLVGHVAKRQSVSNPENTVFASKRLMGRRFSSPQVKEAIAHLPFKVVSDEQDEIRVAMGGENLSLQEIAAMVLVELKLDAEAFLQGPVSKVVLTVPAYFTTAQRQATKDAARIAGLEVVRLLNEPTAAALAYGLGKSVEGYIAVFDLGGGTFDVSILEVKNEVFEVVATGGDSQLGGEDFDNAIVDELLNNFEHQHGVNLRNDRVALLRVKEAAENAKIELSQVGETQIHLPFIASLGEGSKPLHLQASLTRKRLEDLTDALCRRAVTATEQVLRDAKIPAEKLKEIILVGGMTRMPKIAQLVKTHFKKEPSKSVHPDEAVALGAALHGDSLLSPEDAHRSLLMDVTPQSLGVVVAGGYVQKLIPKGTTVPTSMSQVFNTSKDNQSAVTITIIQGESAVAHENSPLAEFRLTGIPQGKRGEVQIQITFDIDAGGMVSVSAQEPRTGQSQSIVVEARVAMNEEEIRRKAQVQADYVEEVRKLRKTKGKRPQPSLNGE